MAWRDLDIGAVSAYAIAVEHGYTGTEEEWAREQAAAGENARIAKESAESAKSSAQNAIKTLEAIREASTNLIEGIETAGETQISNVQSEGATQISSVKDAGNEQSRALSAQGDVEQRKVIAAGDEQVSRVTNAGNDAVESVTLEKTNAVNSVQSTKAEAVNSVESTKTIAVEAVKSAESAAIQNIGTGVDDTLSISGKAADAKKTGDSISSLKDEIVEQGTLYNGILQIKNTANLMNPDKLETGKVIDANGNVVDGASYRSTSELIAVDPFIQLRVTTNLNQALVQYDADGNKLAATSTFSSATPIELKENTKFVRICVWNDCLPFMLYQSGETMNYVEYGKYSENVRKKVWVYTNETEEEIYLKLYNARKKGNCDIYWECGTYEFSTIFELLKTKYGRTTAYELPIGNNCRYFFNGSTIIGTGISEDSDVIDNSSVFGTFRSAQSYELHDGIIIANHLIYCVHEECSSQKKPYNIKYSNMRMYHNTITEDYDLTYGLRKCIGGGTGLHPCVEVANCFFQTDYGRDIGWHGHSENDKTTFYLNIHNCYFSHGISTDYMSTNETCELLFDGNSTPIIPTSSHDGNKGWKVVSWNNEKRSS